MSTRQFLLATLLLSSALVPMPALAQGTDANKTAARDLALEGYSALQSKDYTAAADRFTRADALYHAPTVTLGLARAQAGLGKLASAQELYTRTAHETLPPNASPGFKKAVLDAQKELTALTPRVPSVMINVKGGDAPRLTLDGVELSAAAPGVKRPVDPGEHMIRAESPGFISREIKVTLAEGKTETVDIQLEPEQPKPVIVVAPPVSAPLPVATLPSKITPPVAAQPPPSKPSKHTPSFVLFGLGGVGAVIGIAFAGAGFSAKSSYDKTPTAAGADKVERDALIADISFGSAVLLGSAGLVTLLIKDPTPPTTGIFLTPRVGPTGATMAAGFRF